MSELSLSLYQLDRDLIELWAMREQVEEQIAVAQSEGDLPETLERLTAEARAIDEAMVLYFEALPRKVDSTADAWLMLERLCGEPKERTVAGRKEKVLCELDREIERLKTRRDGMRKRLESLKERVKFVMEGMQWKPGKPRKIEGTRHTISLVANGGKQPVVVTDESLVPDEFCTVTVTMRRDVWQEILDADFGEDEINRYFRQIQPPRVPSLSLIAAELDKPCDRCDGEPNVEGGCQWCGGTGRRGVPGAQIVARGEHVRCS